MRYLRMFLLYAQEVFEERARLTVWFFLSWISPLILMLFWRGAKNLGDWTIEQLMSYYVLVILMGIFLMSHHEERIAMVDIKEGALAAYLLKPFSYFWTRFFGEITFRIIQGSIALLLFFIFISLFPSFFVFANDPMVIFLSVIMTLLSLFLIFIFKTIIGLLAFWMTEARGAFEAMEALLAAFAGYLMPIAFLPHFLQVIDYLTPFPYMIYFPVISFTGKLTTMQIVQVIETQLLWIVILWFIYRKMWSAGVKKFTGVGQ